MSDILSQEEIDALLSAYSSGGPTASHSAREVRLYDFAHPERFSKEQLRQLEAVHNSFASTAASRLSATLRTTIEVQHTTVDQCTFDDYMKSTPSPTLTCNFRMEPSQARCILEVNPNIALSLVDVMTGGSGDIAAKARALSDIEIKLLESVVKALLAEYESAWDQYTKVACALEKAGSNQMVNPIARATDRMLSVCYELTVGNQVGLVSFCTPSQAIESLLQSIGAVADTAAGASPLSRGDIAESLAMTTVVASAWLGQAEVSVADLLSLEEGDMVRLEQPVNREIRFAVQDVPKFGAVAGVVGSKLALQITRELGGIPARAGSADLEPAIADKDAA